jgi:hypothetical protein
LMSPRRERAETVRPWDVKFLGEKSYVALL